jgi:hypothetical protein
LEHRSLLAGNVLVAVNRGELDITGDNNANGVLIQPGPKPGGFTVTGQTDGGSATSINGVANGTFTAVGVTDDTKIKLGDGNDNLTINNGAVFPKDLDINIGIGTDSVSLANVTVDGKLEVQNRSYSYGTPSGNDTITLGTVTVLDDTQIQTGAGNDTVRISNSTFGQSGGYSRGGDLEVDLGDGNDSLTISNSTVVGDFQADGGNGVNTFTNTNNTFEGRVEIRNFS